MRSKVIISERFEDYRLPSLYIGCTSCDGKCAKDGGFNRNLCINKQWDDASILEIDDDKLIKSYLKNPITSAIVFGLLEPLDQIGELLVFIDKLRNDYHCNDSVVIYTGYTQEECESEGWLKELSRFNNIILKVGRYIPGRCSVFDCTLGVTLASDNQYAIDLNKYR